MLASWQTNFILVTDSVLNIKDSVKQYIAYVTDLHTCELKAAGVMML